MQTSVECLFPRQASEVRRDVSLIIKISHECIALRFTHGPQAQQVSWPDTRISAMSTPRPLPCKAAFFGPAKQRRGGFGSLFLSSATRDAIFDTA